MNKYIIIALLMPTITFGMLRHTAKYHSALVDSCYMRQLFKKRAAATVHVPTVLLMNLVTEASKNKIFRHLYLPGIKSQIRETDFRNKWNSIDAEPFHTILVFIPWDGNNNEPRPQRIKLNGEIINVIALSYPSESTPSSHVIEFMGGTDILSRPKHYQATLTKYEALMKE